MNDHDRQTEQNDREKQRPAGSVRQDILRKAEEIANGNRQSMYGKPERNFQTIAALWSEYLGVRITPSMVGVMMALMKISRMKSGHYKEDNYVDAVNYLLFAADMEGNESYGESI